MHVLDFVVPEERARLRDLWPVMIRDKRWIGELTFRHFKTGEGIAFLNDMFVIDDVRTGKPMNVATVSRDLRPQKLAEEQLRHLNQSLELRVTQRTGELAAANAKLRLEIEERLRADARLQELQSELFHAARLSTAGQMASGLAHELNQPLLAAANSVSAARRLLRKNGVASNTIEEILGEAADAIAQTGQIVRRLREFVRRGDTDKRVENLATMIEDASALASTVAGSFDIATRFSLDPRAARVFADRVQIQQVLTNLMRNAMEAMAKSERRDLTITTALLNETTIEIAVGDSGPGLSQDARDHLFEPFFSTKATGMGLGLSICRSIVEAHEGSLCCGPNEGGGTVFRFTLPAAAVEGAHHAV